MKDVILKGNNVPIHLKRFFKKSLSCKVNTLCLSLFLETY